MEKTAEKGIYICETTGAKNERSGKTLWDDIIADVFFHVAICLAVCTLFGGAGLWLFTLPSAAILFLRLFRNKKIFFIIWLAVLAGVIICFVMFNPTVTEGMKLLGNNVFDISESSQGYRYDRFETVLTGAGADNASRLVAFLLSCFLALGLVMANGRLARIITAAGIFGFTAFIFAYFGVLPGIFPVVLMGAALAAFIAETVASAFKGGIRAMCIAAGIMAAVGGITFAVAPQENTVVTEASERLRDILAFRTVHFANLNTQNDEENKDNTDKDENDETDPEAQDDPGEYGASVNGVTLLVIILAVIGILAVLFIPALYFDKIKKRRDKNRAGMDSEDNATAITSQFMYLMRWFKAKGIYKADQFYEDCVPEIREQMSEDYADKFTDMLGVWREAAFSGKPQSDETRKAMEEFVKGSTDYMWENTDFKEHIRIRYKYAL